MKLAVTVLLLLTTAGAALAVPAVPEIDASSASTAVAIVAGALLIARSRRK
jgi:hypothetical protein